MTSEAMHIMEGLREAEKLMKFKRNLLRELNQVTRNGHLMFKLFN
jgi:hypothetical protein